jgi:hypothetical protein
MGEWEFVKGVDWYFGFVFFPGRFGNDELASSWLDGVDALAWRDDVMHPGGGQARQDVN